MVEDSLTGKEETTGHLLAREDRPGLFSFHHAMHNSSGGLEFLVTACNNSLMGKCVTNLSMKAQTVLGF